MILFLFTWLFVSIALPVIAGETDIVYTGNYKIQLCNSDQADAQATYLQGILLDINANLQAVIKDAQLGTASQRGFGSFFKTNESIGLITQVFSKMAEGANVMVQADVTRGMYKPVSAQPTLVCINNVTETSQLYYECVHEHPYTPLLTYPNSELIALCPLFWEQGAKAVARLDCPNLRGNRFRPNNLQLTVNQQAMIVHELAHVYIKGTLEWPNEKYNINDCLDLDAKTSLLNANNYAMYYAGKHAVPTYVDIATGMETNIKRILFSCIPGDKEKQVR